MTFIDLIHTILLMILIDRTFILRDRYKLAIYNKLGYNGTICIWMLHREHQGEKYIRMGGRHLFTIRFKRDPHKPRKPKPPPSPRPIIPR